MRTDTYIALAILSFLLGFILGQWLVNLRWRNNAEDWRRLEHKGRLYKVNYADEEKPNAPRS